MVNHFYPLAFTALFAFSLSSASAEDLNTQAVIGANLSTRTLNIRPGNPEDIHTPTDIKGWNQLFGLLIQQGIPYHQAHFILSDKRMPKYEPLLFNIQPSEHHLPYHKRNSPKERAHALEFYQKNIQWFKDAEVKYQVPSSVIVSILQIETRCGGSLGKKPVFYHLARLASGASPDSIKKSYKFNQKKHKSVTLAAVASRGEWLQEHFLPHVIATIRIAEKRGISPHEILGSYGGAMGLPQFLPGHLYNYGIDADQNGSIDLNSAPDAILSVANYLHSNGWKNMNLSAPERRLVIWKYNHSDPYVTTTLAMADILEKKIKGEYVAPAVKAKQKSNPFKISKVKKRK